jgi:hypothetical protein
MFFITPGRWFSPGMPVSPTNKTDLHEITEILLKVALNTMSRFAFNVKPIEFLLKRVMEVLIFYV